MRFHTNLLMWNIQYYSLMLSYHMYSFYIINIVLLFGLQSYMDNNFLSITYEKIVCDHNMPFQLSACSILFLQKIDDMHFNKRTRSSQTENKKKAGCRKSTCHYSQKAAGHPAALICNLYGPVV